MKQVILLTAMVAMACAASLIDTNVHHDDDEKHTDTEHQLGTISHGTNGALVNQRVATGVEESSQHIHELLESVGEAVQERVKNKKKKKKKATNHKGSKNQKKGGKKEEEGKPHGKKNIHGKQKIHLLRLPHEVADEFPVEEEGSKGKKGKAGGHSKKAGKTGKRGRHQ